MYTREFEHVLHSEIVIVILSAESLIELLHWGIECVLLSSGSLVELPNEVSAIWSLRWAFSWTTWWRY